MAEQYELFEVLKALEGSGGSGGSPIGSVALWSGTNSPNGWFICDGRAISRTSYSQLFAIIGTTFGSGDGSTTFNIPNCQDNFVVGKSNTKALGSTGGEETHTLTVAEMPKHRHGIFVHLGTAVSSSGISFVNGGATNANFCSEEGGDQPHNNLPPYIALNYIIKAFNESTTPTQSMVIDNLSSTSPTDALSANMGRELALEQKILLWNNSNPSASFGAQTLSINLSDFSIVEIETNFWNGANGLSWGRGFINNQEHTIYGLNTNQLTETGRRTFSANSNGIVFGNGWSSGAGTSGYAMIPQKIYGIKYIN